eukprot:9768595-Lingulodinium_polyedra.AAC.1
MCPAAACSDSSDQGFAVHLAEIVAVEAREEARFREKWRFAEVSSREGFGGVGPRAWQPVDR